MAWTRAGKSKQQAFHEKAGVKSTGELFTQLDNQEAPRNIIACMVSSTKSYSYNCLETHHELFLQQFFGSFAVWAQDLSEGLRKLPAHTHTKVIAKTWMQVTTRHKDFLELAPFLYMALERNCSIAVLLKCDTSMNRPAKKVVRALQCVVPGISQKSAFNLMLYFLHSLTGGLLSLSKSHEDLSRHADYEQHMTHVLEIIIEGLRKETDQRTGITY